MKSHPLSPWSWVVFFLGMLLCFVSNAGVLDKCWKASTQIKTEKQYSLFEEDGRRYFSIDELEFGVKEDGESGFIKVNDIDLGIETIKFTKDKSNAAKFSVGAKDLNMIQGEVVEIKFNSKSIYCLVFPFAGLGSSGNYAKYKAVIAIPKETKKTNEITGAVRK